jgi:hypothetical protein
MNRTASVPNPETLLTSTERYVLIEEIDHAAIMGPINTYLKRLTTIGYRLVVIAYRLCGARQATMQFDPKTLVALAVADRFVATGCQFYFIAAAPSIMLCALCVLLALLVPSVAPVCIGAFAVHAMAALGDWALFNLAWLNRDAEVYTLDDVAARRTYFFRRSHPH